VYPHYLPPGQPSGFAQQIQQLRVQPLRQSAPKHCLPGLLSAPQAHWKLRWQR
jgi:hypothetical protein